MTLLFCCSSSMDSCAIGICIPISAWIWLSFARMLFLFVNVFIRRVWKKVPYRYRITIGRISISDMNSNICTKHRNAQSWLRCLRVSIWTFRIDFHQLFLRLFQSRAIPVSDDWAWLLYAPVSTHGTDCFSNAEWWYVLVIFEAYSSPTSDRFVDHHFNKPEFIMANLQQGIW